MQRDAKTHVRAVAVMAAAAILLAMGDASPATVPPGAGSPPHAEEHGKRHKHGKGGGHGHHPGKAGQTPAQGKAHRPVPPVPPAPPVSPPPAPDPAGPPASPKAAWSYYVKTASPARHRAMGCELGRMVAQGRGPKDALAIMHFGRPMRRLGNHGASLYFGFHPTWRIRRAAQAYVRGYVDCSRRASDAHLRLALGTSNYGHGVTYWHGRSWARMVNAANAWTVRKGLDARADFAGANDIEPGWGPPDEARRWVRGYASAAGSPFYNFGGAAGCPPYGDCHGNWTQADVWYVSSGSPVAIALPEIYTASGASAEQWYRLSLWAHHNRGKPMRIHGVMSQRQACLDQRDPCPGLKIWPTQSWRMLFSRLWRDPRTRGIAKGLRFVTNIRWRN